MKNAILYNIITADVQTGTQSSTIKKAPLSRRQKQKNMNKPVIDYSSSSLSHSSS